MRCFVNDQAGALAKISATLADYQISVEQLHQEPSENNPDDATLVIITDKVKESVLIQALQKLIELDVVDSQLQRIRVADLG
ncbi:hypothetical protein THIOSC15_3350017 [uncultured Thiomicrorhabdus sp.]